MSIDVSSKPKRTYQTWLEQSVLSSHVSAYASYLSDHGTQPTLLASTCTMLLIFRIGWRRRK
jgi:hypothetical protein